MLALLAPFALYVVGAIIAMVMMIGGVFSLGPLPFHDCDDCPARNMPIFPGSGLATHGWLAAGILAIAIASVRDELFFPQGSLTWLAYTPLEDKCAPRYGRWNFWIAIGLVTCWQAAVLGWVARHEQATVLQWALIGPLAVVQTAVVYSLLLVAITLLRAEKRINEATAPLSLLGYGYFALWISQFFPDWTPAIARQLLTLVGWLLPTGWIDALYWHGVLGGQAWSWLLLLPCAAVIAAGIVSRRWPLLLREIRISPQGEFTPILADDPSRRKQHRDHLPGRYQ